MPCALHTINMRHRNSTQDNSDSGRYGMLCALIRQKFPSVAVKVVSGVEKMTMLEELDCRLSDSITEFR